LAPLAAGAAAGGFGVIAFGYIANRYLTDLYPLVLIPGLVGFHLVVRGWGRWPARRRRVIAVVLGGLAVLGVVANPALALEFQRERGPGVDEPARAQWVSWRTSLPGAYAPVRVHPQAFMPEHLFDGRLAVVGECDGLYVRLDDAWRGVQRGPGVDVYDLRVDLDVLPDRARVPLITLGERESLAVVAIRRVGDGLVRVDVSRSTGSSGGWRLGFPTALAGTVSIRVDADPRERDREVSAGSEVLYAGPLPAGTESPEVGAAPPGRGVATTFPDDAVELAPYDPTVCEKAERLVEDDGRSATDPAG
jgi:hypothetical protein